jgi:glycosyltransferase involved in cell wall biosynthesis
LSVVLFHTTASPPDQQAARSLFEAGKLERFETTIADDPSSALQRIVGAAGRMAGRDLAARFRRRAVTEVPPALVRTHPWQELLRLAVGAADRDGRATDFVWEWAEHSFDRAVARGLGGGLTGVYGFEHSSLHTFRRAKELGLAIAYEMPAPETEFSRRIIDAEIERFPEMRTAYHRYTAAREERRLARRAAERRIADVIIAASQFTRSSLADEAASLAKVRIVPIGSPPALPRDRVLGGDRGDGRPARFIWAGTFGIRKGAHHLLNAWREGGFGGRASLRVYGSVALPDRVLRPLPEGIEICGAVSRAELMERFLESDALVFPTLCDGWGMVATEAWACGLPVITTRRAGVSDLLRDGRNGILIEAGGPDEIVRALEWCLAHRGELSAMREAALETALAWQWSDYRKLMARTLLESGLFGGRA